MEGWREKAFDRIWQIEARANRVVRYNNVGKRGQLAKITFNIVDGCYVSLAGDAHFGTRHHNKSDDRADR